MWLDLGILATIILNPILFWFIGKRNVTGEMICGTLIGIFIELITEPDWDYNLKFYIYKDVSPLVILGWGVSFSWVVAVSDFVYKLWVKGKKVKLFDKRVLLTDFVCGTIMFVSVEVFAMHVLHAWTYSPILGWTLIVPIINYPFEGVLGSMLAALILPTFVRYWQKSFDIGER